MGNETQHKRKVALARRLTEEGKSNEQTTLALRKRFGTSLANETVCAIRREVNGKPKEPRVKRTAKAILPVAAPQVTTWIAPALKSMLIAVVAAMRDAGVEGVTVRADGRCRLLSLVSEDFTLGEQ